MKHTSWMGALCVSLVLVGWAPTGAAATRDWTGKTSTDWWNTGNWDPTGTPAGTDTLNIWSAPYGNLPVAGAIVYDSGVISVRYSGISAGFGLGLVVGWDGAGELAVTNGGAVTTNALFVGNDGIAAGSSGLVTVSGQDSILTCTGNMLIGHDGLGGSEAGALEITSKAEVFSGTAVIGKMATSTGNSVTVNSATWHIVGSGLYVGHEGSGSLDILSGAAVYCEWAILGLEAGSTDNFVTVSGSGSLLDTDLGTVTVGESGSATLLVGTGATVSTALGSIAENASAFGTVTVNGADAVWTTNGSDLDVGYHGTAGLNIEAAGLVSSGIGYVGHKSDSFGSIATVTGTGSTWDTNGQGLYVGYEGNGTLNIENGGTVQSGAGVIGHAAGSTGNVVTVTGAGSTWDLGGNELQIGYMGDGTLNILDGGMVASGTGHIGRTMSSTDSRVYLTGAGSTWDLSENLLYVGGMIGSGVLEIYYGATVTCGTAYVGWDVASVGELIMQGGTLNSNMMVVGCAGQAYAEIGPGGTVATSGAFYIGTDGEVNLNGGTLQLGWFSQLDGTLDFNSGTLRITAKDVTLDVGEMLGPVMSYGAGQTFVVDLALLVSPAGQLTAEGGSVQAGAICNDGELTVRNGGEVATDAGLSNTATMTVSGGTVAGAGKLTNEMSGVLTANGLIETDLSNYGLMMLSGALQITGTTNNFGTMSISATQVLRQDGPMYNYGLIELDGGAISGGGALTNRASGVIRGGSGIDVPLTNAGLIHADGASKLLIPDLSGGNEASGEIRIDDGASVQVASGFTNAGLVTLNGAAASLGGSEIVNTGTVRGRGRVANAVANSGTVRAEAGTLALAGVLTNASAGILEALDGAELLVQQGLAVNAGQIALQGGAFDNNNQPLQNTGVIAGHGTFRGGQLTNDNVVGVGGGDLNVIAPVVNNGTVSVASADTAVFYGPVSGPGGFPGPGTVLFLGGYSGGSSPAVVGFGGNVGFGAASVLTIELAEDDNTNPLSPRYDSLTVAGEVSLAGPLRLEWLPRPGEIDSKFGGTYDLITYTPAGGLTGEFSAIDCDFGAYIEGIDYDADVHGDGSVLAVRLTLHELIDGDADFSGTVDYADYAAVRDAFGAAGDWPAGDFDLTGDVDWLDYVTLKAHWAQALPPAAPGSSVPEPATLALLAAGAVAALSRRRRK